MRAIVAACAGAVEPSFGSLVRARWSAMLNGTPDLGVAFAAVLVLIYILVVWCFQSFGVPLTIMAAIPFSLVGILPAHAAMGAFFTATSMIGFIALAGIIVRNSIILVDFIELRRAQGMSLEDAVVDAGAVRFRPMLLTAAAVVVGASAPVREVLFENLPPITGGRRITMVAPTGLVQALTNVGAALTSQYVVSFEHGDGPVSGNLQAGARRGDAVLRAAVIR